VIFVLALYARRWFGLNPLKGAVQRLIPRQMWKTDANADTDTSTNITNGAPSSEDYVQVTARYLFSFEFHQVRGSTNVCRHAIRGAIGDCLYVGVGRWHWVFNVATVNDHSNETKWETGSSDRKTHVARKPNPVGLSTGGILNLSLSLSRNLDARESI